jgi:hypothetical protein
MDYSIKSLKKGLLLSIQKPKSVQMSKGLKKKGPAMVETVYLPSRALTIIPKQENHE